jgi:DNA-binding MarR family transcriptional regulator
LEKIHSLEESIGFTINVVGRLMKRALFLRLAEVGVTPTQWTVLMCLWEQDGLSFTELGNRLCFDHPTITGVVDRMEREKLVKRRRDHIDRRVVKVSLTQKGKDLKSVIVGAGEEVDKMTISELSTEQLGFLKQWIKTSQKKLITETRMLEHGSE